MLGKRDHGFTLVELLIVVGILAVLAAASVPTYVALERQGNENASRTALMGVRQSIIASLPAWRGYPPTGMLAICIDPRDANEFLFADTVANGCAEGRWNTLTSRGTATSPPLNGDLPEGVFLTGLVGGSGDFCLTAVHADAPAPFHITDTEAEATEGSCSTVGWRPTTTSTGTPDGGDPNDWLGLPDLVVSGITVSSPTTTQVTVAWTSVASVVYDVILPGVSQKSYTATNTTAAVTFNSVPPGTYTVAIRPRTLNGTGQGGTLTFTAPVTTGTSGAVSLPFPKSHLHIITVDASLIGQPVRLPTTASTIEYLDFGSPTGAQTNIANNGAAWVIQGTTIRAKFDWDNTGGQALGWIKDVQQFGRNSRTGKTNQIASGVDAFKGITAPTLTALPTLDITNLTSAERMFQNATGFNQDISGWDVSRITNMGGMFQGATAFNQDLHVWDVRTIANTPVNFATSTAAWTKNKPKFGYTRCGDTWYRGMAASNTSLLSAQTAATAAGGWLPAPTSAQANTCVRNLASNKTIPLALSDAGSEGLWMVTDGPLDGRPIGALGYSNWAPSEPAGTDPEADYATMTSSGTWQAQPDTFRYDRYVIAWEPTP